jgi:hypothetical protein
VYKHAPTEDAAAVLGRSLPAVGLDPAVLTSGQVQLADTIALRAETGGRHDGLYGLGWSTTLRYNELVVPRHRRRPPPASRQFLRINAFVPLRVVADEVVDLDSRSVPGAVADPVPVMTIGSIHLTGLPQMIGTRSRVYGR